MQRVLLLHPLELKIFAFVMVRIQISIKPENKIWMKTKKKLNMKIKYF